jgi:hypothetical protein
MAQLTLDVGSNANDGTGDTLRDAMVKVNTNFTELFSSPLIASGVTVSGNEIRSNRSNDDLKFIPSGTGNVIIETGTGLTVDSNISINDNTIKTTVTNSNLELSGSGTGVVDILSALTTASVTAVGDWAVTGTHTIEGILDVDYVRIKDNVITTNASNADLVISASSSGVVKIDDIDIGGGAIDNAIVGGTTPLAGTFTTLTGNTSITIDSNIMISDNQVKTTASNSNLELSASGSGKVSINGLLYPNADGSANQVLSTNGAGTLSFATAGATLSHSDIADGTTTVATSTTTAIDTFVHATYRSAKYFISISDSTNTRFEIVEANVTHDGSNAFVSTFGRTTNYTGDLATFSAAIAGSNVELRVTNTSADSTIFKFQKTTIDV